MIIEDPYNELYDYLYAHLYEENKKYFGCNEEWISHVVRAWLNDASNSEHRYLDMYKFLGKEKVKNSCILDMASGCGTFVFYGLLNGIDVYCVEPEQRKNTFNLMKIDTFKYPQTWKFRFISTLGEDLPFKDYRFHIISSYQTLEHVQNVERVLAEMVRCVKWDGYIFLRSPDYFSTFEGHYRLPWLPLFPRKMAKWYLRALGKPTIGLDMIQYVTRNSVKRILQYLPVQVIERRPTGLKRRVKGLINNAFRSEGNIDFLIFKTIDIYGD